MRRKGSLLPGPWTLIFLIATVLFALAVWWLFNLLT